MALGTTNTNLTQIAVKRLSGKAMTNSNLSIPQEGFGSTVQTAALTVFGEVLPNSPVTGSENLFLIQSQSDSHPGTVMLVDFELQPINDSQYPNVIASGETDTLVYEGDQGGTNINTFHAYVLRLTGSFAEKVVAQGATYFADNATTPVVLGNAPFTSSFTTTGSVQLQIVPEFVSTINGSTNPYIAQVSKKESINTFEGASALSANSGTSGIDYYLDPFSGILFVQDPVDFTGTGNVPGKVRAFVYVGKYQTDVVSGDTVNLHISASEGTGFSIANNATASFESGSAGITVTAGGTNKITIGTNTDNVTFNNITATGNLIAQNYIVSSSVTHMTQSFSDGSTIFGDSIDDTHIFSGSLILTGSLVAELSTNSELTPLVIDSSGNVFEGTVDILNTTITSISGAIDAATGSLSSSIVGTANEVKVTSTGPGNVTIGLPTNIKVSGHITASGNISSSSDIIANRFFNGPIIGASTFSVDEAGNITTANNLTAGGSATLDTQHLKGKISLTGNVTSSGNISSSGHILADRFKVQGKSLGLYHAGSSTVRLGDTTQATRVDGSNIELNASVTASIISASGNLFAKLTDAAGSHNNTVMYSTTTGQLFFTGSYGGGGGGTITDEMATAISGAINIATGSLSSSITGVTHEIEVTNGGTLGNIIIGLPDQVRISSSLLIGTNAADPAAAALTTTHTGTFNLIDDNTTTINFGGDATTINMGAAGNSNVIIKGSASIDGDLTVKGVTTTINTTELNVEDPFILLNSGSNSGDGGIIVQTTSNGVGTALFYDDSVSRWGLTKADDTAYSVTTATPRQYVVSVSSSAANPTSNPSDFGAAAASYVGMMYVATTDNDGDKNTIWIYG